MQHLTKTGGGKTGSLWPTQTIRKLYKKYIATLLLNSLTIPSPSDYLRWNPPNAALPYPSFNQLVSHSSIGRISQLFGFNESRRYFLIRLFNLAYSFRVRLPLLISAGFALCHFFLTNVDFPLEVQLEIETDEEDDEEADIDVEVEVDYETDED